LPGQEPDDGFSGDLNMNTLTRHNRAMVRVGAVLAAFLAVVLTPGWRLSPVMADEWGGTTSISEAMANEPSIMSEMPMQIVLTSGLLGKSVRNMKGEELGRLGDIVLTPDQTSASYVVISRGGFLGLGERLFAVPWTAVSVSSDGRRITTAINRSELTSEASFDRLAWPDVGETRWSEMPYYSDSMQTFNPDQGAFPLRRVSQITRLDAGNRQGKFLGSLENLGIERASGRVVYGVVSLDGGLLTPKKMAAVPWDMVILQDEPAVAGINLDRKAMESVAFEKSQWPNWGERGYSMMLYRTFGEEPYQQVYGYAAAEERTGTTEPWMTGSDYNARFNASSIETIRGTVQSVGTFRPASHAVSGLLLTIRTPDGRTVSVQGGPRPYITRMEFNINTGNDVTVTGSNVQIGGRQVLIASQIGTAGRTLKLRDPSGSPLWTSPDLRAKFPAPAGRTHEPTEKDYPGGDMGY
jgi:sporulation protein YlmC with PRC-barrel domain